MVVYICNVGMGPSLAVLHARGTFREPGKKKKRRRKKKENWGKTEASRKFLCN